MATQTDDVSDAAARLGRVSLSSSASSSNGNLTEPHFGGSGKKGKKDGSRKGEGASNGHGNGSQSSNGRGSSKASSSGDVQICFDFTKGTCSRGENCRFSHDIATIVNVNSQERGICFDFVRGQCNRGLLCRFSHDLTNLNQAPPPVRTQKSGAICYDYVKGACSRGNDCRYSHDINSIAGSFRVPGISAEICYDFSRGRCTRGTACRYSHDAGAAGVAVAATSVAAVTARSSSSQQPQGPAKKPIMIPVTSSAAEQQQQARSASGAATQAPAPPQEPQQQQQLPPAAPPASHSGGSRYVDVLGSKTQPKPAAPAPQQQMEKAEVSPPPPPPPSQQQQHILPPAPVLPPQPQPTRGGAYGEVGVIGGSAGGQAAAGQRADSTAAASLLYEYTNGAHAAEQQQQQRPLALQQRGPPDGILLNSAPGSGLEHQHEQQMGDIAAGIGRMVDAGLEAAPQQQQKMIGGSAGLAPGAPSGMPISSAQQRPVSAQGARGLPSPQQPFEYPQARAAPPPPPRPQQQVQQQQQHASFSWGKDQILQGGMERQQRSASGPLLSAAGGSSAVPSTSMDPVLPMSKAPSSNGLGLANGQFPSGAQTSSAPGAGMAHPSWGVAGAPQMNNGMNQSTLGHLRQIWNRSG